MKFWEAWVRHASTAIGQSVSEEEAILVGRSMGMTTEELNTELPAGLFDELWALQLGNPAEFNKVIQESAAEWVARN